MIEKLLKGEFWRNGYFCVVDWGDSSLEMPDIAVIEPAPKTVKDKYGNDQRILNPWVWNYTTATAVEIEMSPLKNKEQVIKNYQKNKAFYKLIRFVVTSENHKEQLYQILNEEQPPDPNKYWIQVMKFESSTRYSRRWRRGRKRRRRSSGAKKAGSTCEDAEESDPFLHSGQRLHEQGGDRPEVGERGIEIASRSVSRCLKALTEKGMLQAKGRSTCPRTLPRTGSAKRPCDVRKDSPCGASCALLGKTHQGDDARRARSKRWKPSGPTAASKSGRLSASSERGC